MYGEIHIGENLRSSHWFAMFAMTLIIAYSWGLTSLGTSHMG